MSNDTDLIPALRGGARRLDNENAILRAALITIAEQAQAAGIRADALDLDDPVTAALDTILEHGAHAWRALTHEEDGPWPPDTTAYTVGSAAYHLAAMLGTAKRLYDQRAGR